MSHVATFCHVRHVTSYFDAAKVLILGDSTKFLTPFQHIVMKKSPGRATLAVHGPEIFQLIIRIYPAVCPPV